MLQPVTRQKVDSFFSHFTHRYYKKRETLIHTEELKTHIYYIKNGFVRAYRISEEGEELTLLILKPDDFFPLTYDSTLLFSQAFSFQLTSFPSSDRQLSQYHDGLRVPQLKRCYFESSQSGEHR